MTLSFDPQCAPAPTTPSDLDLVDLADEVFELALAAVPPSHRGSGLEYLAMIGLLADFTGADLTRFAQFKRYLAERTPAPGQNGLF